MHFENKIFKKVFILVIFATVLCVPIFVFSQGFGLNQTATKSGFDTGSSDIYKTIGNIVNVAFATVAFIFFGLTVYAGLRWLTARGQEKLIEKAKGTMESAIIGLIVVALSYAIANFVIGRLGVPEKEEGKLGCCILQNSSIGAGPSTCETKTQEDCKIWGGSKANFISTYTCNDPKAKTLGCY